MTCVKSNLLLYTDVFFNLGQNGRHGRRGHPGTYKILEIFPYICIACSDNFPNSIQMAKTSLSLTFLQPRRRLDLILGHI